MIIVNCIRLEGKLTGSEKKFIEIDSESRLYNFNGF